jgi:hypothetical protein
MYTYRATFGDRTVKVKFGLAPGKQVSEFLVYE